MITIEMRYFAQLAVEAGRERETLSGSFADMAALFAELSTRYGFSLSQKQLRVARNQVFCAWSEVPQEGDEIAFIPPVSGG